MESKLLSSVDPNPAAEAPLASPETRPHVDDLAEVARAVGDDCRVAPESYHEEIRVAASGE